MVGMVRDLPPGQLFPHHSRCLRACMRPKQKPPSPAANTSKQNRHTVTDTWSSAARSQAPPSLEQVGVGTVTFQTWQQQGVTTQPA